MSEDPGIRNTPHSEQDGIWIGSGVSLFSGEPFCTIFVDGRQVGQLDPDAVRQMALQWLSAAEAAEQDAMVMAELQESVNLPIETAAAFVAALRQRRTP